MCLSDARQNFVRWFTDVTIGQQQATLSSSVAIKYERVSLIRSATLYILFLLYFSGGCLEKLKKFIIDRKRSGGFLVSELTFDPTSETRLAVAFVYQFISHPSKKKYPQRAETHNTIIKICIEASKSNKKSKEFARRAFSPTAGSNENPLRAKQVSRSA
jgi:hypothetical protein